MAANQLPSLIEQIEQIEARARGAETARAAEIKFRAAQTFFTTVAGLTEADAAPAQTERTLDLGTLGSAGAILRIPAGGTATLRLNDVAGWHYDSATLHIRPHGRNMALPITLEPNTPGPDSYPNALTATLSPPPFIGNLVFAYGVDRAPTVQAYETGDSLDVMVDGAEQSLFIPTGIGTNIYETHVGFIGGNVSRLTLKQLTVHGLVPLVAAIVPNVAEGLSVAQDDDRILHTVPRKLSFGDTATTADLSPYFNQSSSGETVLRIGARGDCCVSIHLEATRRRVSEGVLGDPLGEDLNVSLWRAANLSPALPIGAGVTTTLQASVTPSGPARLGLRIPHPAAMCQGVELPPRVSLLQPFELPQSDAAPRTLTGIWLMLSVPPRETETLHVDICTFNPAKSEAGDTLATCKVEISPRLMDLTDIGDGLFAQWTEFDAPLEIDTPDLRQTFALLLRDLSGPVSLLEGPLTGHMLSPALSRNLARSDRWAQRRFGQDSKALIFEIGENREGALLTLTADGAETHVPIADTGEEIHVSVPAAATLAVSSNRDLVLSAPKIVSSTAPSSLA